MDKNKKRGREDYLRAIYTFHDDKEGAKSMDIAKELNVSKASVSEMARKLANQGYLKVSPYSKIILTKKGGKYAEKLYDRHRIIKRFIKKFIGHDEDRAYKEAHELEHGFSDETIEILSQMIDGKKHFHIPQYIG